MTLKESRASSDRAYLFRLLSDAGGNLNKAARIAGIHRTSLYKLLEKRGLKVEHRKYVRQETVG